MDIVRANLKTIDDKLHHYINGQAPARIISTKYNSADLQPIPELIQAAQPDPAGAIA